ncbi:MAG: hypothetical protein IKO89_02325 [Bacteroidales bacterium]|nr:hypothetical protein [Bacteroidales bacterium]MBR4487380.1 hypothetical protein [Bacteroidales bacterium]
MKKKNLQFSRNKKDYFASNYGIFAKIAQLIASKQVNNANKRAGASSQFMEICLHFRKKAMGLCG